jgi:hypothetical protein
MLAAALVALLAAPVTGQEGLAPVDQGRLVALAPVLTQIVALAALDPVLAANLVPDPWIDSFVSGALTIEAESSRRAEAQDPPQRWPIGPWATPASMVQLIHSVDPRAVLALYRALTPRLEVRCSRRAMSFERCDRTIRAAGSRLAACSVLERTAGRAAAPITPTQRALARLGGSVVLALRTRIHSVASALWGASWDVPARCDSSVDRG